MARIRSVHPDICASQTLAGLSANLERTFVRLWTHCDDEGRCEDRPRLIKAGIYPEHDDMTWERVDADLWELSHAGLIVRYEQVGKRYLAVRSWGEYQHPQKPRASRFPPPPEVPTPDPTGTSTGRVREQSRKGKGLELGVGEGEGEGEEIRAATVSPTLTVVSTNGSSPPVTAHANPSDFEAWWTLYPRKVAKAAAAKAWKTARGNASWDQLIDGLNRSTAAWRAEGRPADKIPHASTWLNGRRWEDQPATPSIRPEPKGFAGIRAALEQRGSL